MRIYYVADTTHAAKWKAVRWVKLHNLGMPATLNVRNGLLSIPNGHTFMGQSTQNDCTFFLTRPHA